MVMRLNVRSPEMIRRASMVLGTLALAACVTTVAVTDRMPESATLAEGEGMVIGSIVVTTPTDVADPDQKEMIDALKQRTLTATIRRYVMRVSDDEGGEFGWADYVGDKFVVSFGADAEQRFVIRAPAGKYSVYELSDIHPGLFGDQPGCKMNYLAKFEVHAGRTTYIGGLVVRAGFKSGKMLSWEKSFERSTGIGVVGIPERWLNMSLSATDARLATLRDLPADPSRAPAEIETELMRVGIGRWQYDAPQIPEPPKVRGAN